MDMEISVAKFRWSKYCTLEKDYENSVSVGNIRALRNMQHSEVGKPWTGHGKAQAPDPVLPELCDVRGCAPLYAAHFLSQAVNSCQLTV